jgi:spore germination protein GerM
MRALVEALAAGPRGDGAPVLPKDTRLRGAYVGKDGLALLDLEPWPEGTELGGASGELLAVFALVQTITQNVPGIRSVQLLVGGEERETLAGHVKISEPLRPETPTGVPGI